MAHIAMVSIPYPGHVNPSLELVRILVERGHRVSYANDFSARHDNGARTRTAVAGTGAELRSYRSTLRDWDGDAIDHLTGFQTEYESMLPQLRALYDHDRPDLFLYDIAGMPARILADQWDVPIVQLSPTYVAWDGYEEDMADFLDGVRADPRGAALRRREQEFLDREGIVADAASYLGRPRRCVVLIPPSMQPHPDRVDPDVYTFVGPVLQIPETTGAWQRPAGAERVLLVSLGSAFTDRPDFYRRCVEAYGDLPGWGVVLQVGRHVEPSALGPIPDNVEVHDWVPQFEILTQADAFVTHAGMGGSSEGLFTGTPMIAAPQDVDQFENADRLVAAGVAVRVDGASVSVDDLRQALVEVTGEAVTARATSLAAEVRAAGGLTAAVRVIEGLLPG